MVAFTWLQSAGRLAETTGLSVETILSWDRDYVLDLMEVETAWRLSQEDET